MQSPGLTPKTWHNIHSLDNTENLALTRLEAQLGWPKGTIATLNWAFSKHLSRAVGWDLSSLPNQGPSAQASRVFRRGVASSAYPMKQVDGAYEIRLLTTGEPFSDIPNDGPKIVDSNLHKFWKLSLRPTDLVLDLAESTKNLSSVAQILGVLRSSSGVVTIIGGGILADTAAFAAALENRPFRLVPSTLLAMIDACVGGKTGVNFEPHGKNQLGLFAFPLEVLIHSAWLKTLPERELKAGLAEAYKHALISGDRDFAKTLTQLPLTPEYIEPYLHRLVKIKADIVQEDPNEAGRRAVLNFGHTLAHALESISQRSRPFDPILHGEALAIGMLFAVLLSFHEGYLHKDAQELIQEQLRKSQFMPSKSEFFRLMGNHLPPFEDLIEGILQDKKNMGEKDSSEWVLLKDFGDFAENRGVFTVGVKLENVKKTWATFVTQENYLR